MKCIKANDGTVIRVDELTAQEKVTSSDFWNYCPKSEWKEFQSITTKKKNNSKKKGGK